MATIRNQADNPGAVIVDGHGHTDLGVARALGSRGVPVFVATNDRQSPVCFSRYVERVFPFPADTASDLEKVQALRMLGRHFEHRPVLFPTGDATQMLFSRHRTALEHYYRHHLAEPELVEDLADKRRFARLAVRKRLPVPQTVVPQDRQQLNAALWALRFPVAVKPADKREWAQHAALHELTGGNLKAVRIESPRELLAFYDAVRPYNDNLVVQEYVDGRDEALYSLYVYVDQRGQVSGTALSQKVRTHPPHRGVGTCSVTRQNRAIRTLGLSAVMSLGLRGMAIVQVKWSPRDNRWLILEINPRHGTSIGLYPEAGVNLPYAAYRDSIGFPVAALPEQRDGVRWIDMPNDWATFRRYRQLGEWGWWSFLRSYRGPRTYATFAWHDPRPAFVPLVRRMRRKSGKLSHRIGGFAKR